MSASSKPPRRRPEHSKKQLTPERVARVLLDAEVFGDKAAARKHGVHANSVKNWRRDRLDEPAVAVELNRLRALVSAQWIDEARNARRAIISRMVELAARSKNLRSVTEAGRRINEMVMAHEVLTDDPGAAADALADDVDQRAPAGPAQGEGGAPGDDGEGDLGGGEG